MTTKTTSHPVQIVGEPKQIIRNLLGKAYQASNANSEKSLDFACKIHASLSRTLCHIADSANIGLGVYPEEHKFAGALFRTTQDSNANDVITPARLEATFKANLQNAKKRAKDSYPKTLGYVLGTTDSLITTIQYLAKEAGMSSITLLDDLEPI